MTNLKAIANRNSIMLKVDTSIFNAGISWNGVSSTIYIYLDNGSQFEDMDAFGVCYYTTNSNSVTYIPLSSNQIEKTTSWQGNVYYQVHCNVTDNNLTVGHRLTPTYPLFFLLQGLSANTTYHISGYYSLNGTKTIIGYNTVKTKPARSTFFTFGEVTFHSSTTGHEANANETKAILDEALPKVAAIFNDCTDVSVNYNPVIKYDNSSNWAANSYMEFNCRSATEGNAGRSVIIHELEHNHFGSKVNGSHGYPNDANVIKFMEFATDCENAQWGVIGMSAANFHCYPIISSARYGYVDDYLVCMATDVDYLFGTNS